METKESLKIHLSQSSDIHLCVDRPERSLLFGRVGLKRIQVGPAQVPPEDHDQVRELIARCQGLGRQDFMIQFNDLFYRGRTNQETVDGTWFRLRKMPEKPPRLDALPSSLPPHLEAALIAGDLRQGGLVYLCGAPGSGKTTTASAALVSRLHLFGGFAYSVEDPPEFPLNGWHGDGYCAQNWVQADEETGLADWAEAFRGVLRSQPSGVPSILYVGEVRDQESAEACLRACTSGFLVIATGFGTDVISGIETIARLAGAKDKENHIWTQIAAMLRVVIHQRIVDGSLHASGLINESASTAIAARIRGGQLTQLVTDIERQTNFWESKAAAAALKTPPSALISKPEEKIEDFADELAMKLNRNQIQGESQGESQGNATQKNRIPEDNLISSSSGSSSGRGQENQKNPATRTLRSGIFSRIQS